MSELFQRSKTATRHSAAIEAELKPGELVYNVVEGPLARPGGARPGNDFYGIGGGALIITSERCLGVTTKMLGRPQFWNVSWQDLIGARQRTKFVEVIGPRESLEVLLDTPENAAVLLATIEEARSSVESAKHASAAADLDEIRRQRGF